MRMNPKTPHLKKCEALMSPVNPHHKGVKPETVVFSQPAAATRDDVPAGFSARESDVCKTVQRARVLGQVASSGLNFRDNCRGLPVRNPSEKTLDPLSSFMMLRAQQTAPSSSSPSPSQSPASPSGRLIKIVEPFLSLTRIELGSLNN